MRFARLRNGKGVEFVVNPAHVVCVVLDDPYNSGRGTVVLVAGTSIRTADDLETLVRVLEDASRDEPKS